MSSECRAFCPNFNECANRLSAATQEGRYLDIAEQKWGEGREKLFVADVEQQIILTGLEMESSAEAALLDASGATATDTKLSSTLENARRKMAEIQKGYGVVDSVLEENAKLQQINSEEVIRIAAGFDAIQAAEATCSGPVLNIRGRLRLWGDAATRSQYNDESVYMIRYAKCGSKAAQAAMKDVPVPTRQYYPSTPNN